MYLARLSPGTVAARRQNRGRSRGASHLGEAYLVYRLLKELLRRLAGIPAGSSFLATTFAFGVLANALRRIAAPALRTLRPRVPSLAAIIFALAAPIAILRRVTGARAADSLLVGTTVAVRLVAPALRAGAASARTVSAVMAALGRLAVGRPPGG
jgi:hypothetical protein